MFFASWNAEFEFRGPTRFHDVQLKIESACAAK